MEQLNISQLRNLWLRSPDERLASWREFRIELQEFYNSCDGNAIASYEAIGTWWNQMPEVSVAIDPYSPTSWPTVWEIIYQGECCKYSRGLAMAYNIHYLDPQAEVTLHRVRDEYYGDEYMMASVADYGLNLPHDNLVELSSVDSIEIRESFDMRSLLETNQY